MQLDMFLPEAITEVKEKCERTAVLCDKLRKSFHGKHHSLEKYVTELYELLQVQQREIDRLKSKIYEDKLVHELKCM